MNDTFNFKRFLLLLQKTLLERPMQLFGFTGLIILFSLVFYFVCKSIVGFMLAQNLTFVLGLVGGGSFMSSFIFSYFFSNASGSSYLTLPASHFEKWLCGVLIAGILFPLIFMLSYRAIDTSLVGFYHQALDPSAPFYKEKYDAVYLFAFNGVVANNIYTIFFFSSSAMVVGSLYFNKVAFIKVSLVVAVGCLGIYVLNWLVAKSFFGSIATAFPFKYVDITLGKESGSIELPKTSKLISSYSLCYIYPALLWVLAYVRLREKEF